MKKTVLSLVLMCVLSSAALTDEVMAHDPASATYIANEGVLVTNGDTKIMFDPLFDEGFGTYLTLPAETRAKMMAGEAPFDGINAVFVSHAHGDHFAAKDMAAYLDAQPGVHLFAPQQAINRLMLALMPGADDMSRIHSFSLNEGDAAITKSIDGITAEAVRIAHAGNRPTIENTIFRVTLNDSVTVMHMGDANANLATYRPHESHWKAKATDMAFPPYWLVSDARGLEIIDFINIDKVVGTHVPIKVPNDLKRSGADYFTTPGETRLIGRGHSHE